MDFLILGGTPGSGKTTWRKKNLPRHFSVVEFDESIRKLQKKYPEVPLREITTRAYEESENQVGAHFKAGKDVAYDAPNLTKKHRKSLLQKAQKYGAKTIGIWIETSFSESLLRNENREFSVPLENQIFFYSVFEPFSEEEGFLKIEKKIWNPDKKPKKEILDFLRRPETKWKPILKEFPEIAEAEEAMSFFHISLKSVFMEPISPEEKIRKVFTKTAEFWYEFFLGREMTFDMPKRNMFLKNYHQRISAERIGTRQGNQEEPKWC